MIAQVFLLAFASAFWPLLVAATVVMLASRRPLPQLLGYLAGGMLMTIGLGIVILVVLDRTGGLDRSNKQTTSPVVDIVAGSLALLIVLAMVTGWDQRLRRTRPRAPRAKPEKVPLTQRVLARNSFWLSFALGIVLSFPSVYYLAALKDIDEGWGISGAAIALIVGFALVQFLIVEVPLVSFLISPEQTRIRVDAFNRWLGTHFRQIGEVIGLVVGILLIVRGIIDLVS